MGKPVARVTFGAACALFLCLAIAQPASGDPIYLFDTGPGGTSSIGAADLFGTGSPTCGPQPSCQAQFQFLAAQFTLTQSVTLDSIEAWVKGGTPTGNGGMMDVKIRTDVNGKPSTSAPPLYSPNSIFSKRYAVTNFPSAGWLVFPQYASVLAAGTYWVTLEPVDGTDVNYAMPGGVANPLAKYAYYANGNSGYAVLPATSAYQLGIRIKGTPFDGVAFGTATRTIAQGGYFSSCCPYAYDLIREGTRDFTPLGTEGPALTVSYIFVFGTAEVHARGSLIENGLSAGAYSGTGDASGAGRGVAYRTFMNMSDVSKTIRANASLHGAFTAGGGVARAGIYAFDTVQFSDTLTAAPASAAEYLLATDGLANLSNTAQSISLARFFPNEALLASDLETASFPIGSPDTLPMQTGLFTISAGGTFTLLFDVSVFSGHGGGVNFYDTLSPAASFFTDSQGQPVVEIVGVGPEAPASKPASSIVLAPASATKALGAEAAVTATVTDSEGHAVTGAVVSFSITNGPNSPGAAAIATDADGEATFTYSSSGLGGDTIQATVSALQSSSVTVTWQCGLKGDANVDQNVDVSDVFYLINALFAGGPPPVGCVDANTDGHVDIGDVFFLINYLFAGGPAPG
jgi:Bacterial Ig-like domain (group 1)/Dockerin type I domain